MSRSVTLATFMMALLAFSAMAQARPGRRRALLSDAGAEAEARPWRRRALLGSGPACEAMPPRGGPTDTVSCGSQCTASTQEYTACCDRMFDLYIVDPSCRTQPPPRCDMLHDDTDFESCCLSKDTYQIFDATC